MKTIRAKFLNLFSSRLNSMIRQRIKIEVEETGDKKYALKKLMEKRMRVSTDEDVFTNIRFIKQKYY